MNFKNMYSFSYYGFCISYQNAFEIRQSNDVRLNTRVWDLLWLSGWIWHLRSGCHVLVTMCRLRWIGGWWSPGCWLWMNFTIHVCRPVTVVSSRIKHKTWSTWHSETLDAGTNEVLSAGTRVGIKTTDFAVAVKVISRSNMVSSFDRSGSSFKKGFLKYIIIIDKKDDIGLMYEIEPLENEILKWKALRWGKDHRWFDLIPFNVCNWFVAKLFG